jgi:hypothetical protein
MPSKGGSFDLRMVSREGTEMMNDQAYRVDKSDASKVEIVLRVFFDNFGVMDSFRPNILMTCSDMLA